MAITVPLMDDVPPILVTAEKGPSEAQGPSLLSESLADLAFLLDRKE